MSHAMHRVEHVEVVGPYTLALRFEDGAERQVDLEPVLEGELFGALRDPSVFGAVQIDPNFGTVQWPNGADFDPDTLYDWPKYRTAFIEMAPEWAKRQATAHRSPRQPLRLGAPDRRVRKAGVRLNRRLSLLVFIALATLATLLPPYLWGQERVSTEADRIGTARFHPDLFRRLPIKQRAFLFGPNSRGFLEWTWDGKSSVRRPVTLHRRLAVQDLVLEYTLCALVALGAGVVSGTRPRSSTSPLQAPDY